MEFLTQMCAVIVLISGLGSTSRIPNLNQNLLVYCGDGHPQYMDLVIYGTTKRILEKNPPGGLETKCEVNVTLGNTSYREVTALTVVPTGSPPCDWITVASVAQPSTKYDMCHIEPWETLFEGDFMIYIDYGNMTRGNIDIFFTPVHPINCLDKQGGPSCNQTRADTHRCVNIEWGGRCKEHEYECDMSCSYCDVTPETCCYNDGYGETGEEYEICDMFSCISVYHICDERRNCVDGTDENQKRCEEMKKEPEKEAEKRRKAKGGGVIMRGGVAFVVFALVCYFIMAA